MTKPLNLDPITARCEAAIAGPWLITEDPADLTRWVTDDTGALEIGFGYLGNRTKSEAEFVAHARQDVPELLAEVRRLRAANTALHEATTAVHAELHALITDERRPGARARIAWTRLDAALIAAEGV